MKGKEGLTIETSSKRELTKKRFKLDLRATLKRMKFDPTHHLVNILPQLEPKDKAKVLVELHKLIFAPPAQEQPKLPRTRIGKQINVQQNGQLTEEHLRALRQIATSSDDQE